MTRPSENLSWGTRRDPLKKALRRRKKNGNHAIVIAAKLADQGAESARRDASPADQLDW